MYGTPVIGSNIGGIPELIDVGQTGELFEANNERDLEEKILDLWNDEKKLQRYTMNCKRRRIESLESYVEKLIHLYKEKIVTMKVIEVGTGYTSIPANKGAATEKIIEELSRVFKKQNVNYEILDIQDENRQSTDLNIKEVKVNKVFRKTDVTLGIKHKIKRTVYSIKLAKALKKEIKDSKENIVIHFHNQYNMYFFCKLVPKKIRKKVKLMYTVHSYVWNGKWDEIKHTLHTKYFQECYCVKHADKVFILNDITRKYFVEKIGVDESKIVNINNGVNVHIFTPCEEKTKDFIFFQSGSVCDRKNQLGALEILKKSLQENDNYRYIYSGGIIDENYKKRIDNYVEENGLENKVQYIPEFKSSEELSKYYKQANAFIFPTKAEAFGLVIIEAMACGLPVIMNKNVILELLDELKDKLLLYEDEESFDKLLKEKILNEQERKKLTDSARKIIEEKYSWEVVANDYLKAFKEYGE